MNQENKGGSLIHNLCLNNKGKILWTGSFEELQVFVEETLNLTGDNWTSPGGDAKLFQNQATAIKWYGNSKTITVSKDSTGTIKEQLMTLASISQNLADQNTRITFDDSTDGHTVNETEKECLNPTGKFVNSSEVNSSELSEADAFAQILERILTIEEKLNTKIDDVAMQVCKLKEAEDLHEKISHNYITNIKHENENLKKENIALKEKIEYTTMVMSDLNTKLKLLDEEKQSLVTALKILQGKEFVMNDWRNNEIGAFTNVDNKLKQNSGMAKPTGSKRQFGNLFECKNTFELLTVEDDSDNDNDKQETVRESLCTGTQVAEEEATVERNVINDQEPNKKEVGTQMQARGKPSHAQQINQLHELAKPKKKKEHQTNQDLEIAENSSEQIHDQTEPSTSKRYPENKPINLKPIILLGDSIIKHIDPKKLSRRTVYKYTYPGKTCEEIKEAVDDLPTDLDPSHVILHCGTNNLVIDSADVCVTKIKNLAEKVENKFPNAKLGISGLTYREDIVVNSMQVDVNEKLKKLCLDSNFTYIDNSTIDQTCLNGSKLHLNGKGSSLLAVRFIKFLRAQSSRKQHDHTGERDFQMALLKQVGEMLTKIGRKRRT